MSNDAWVSNQRVMKTLNESPAAKKAVDYLLGEFKAVVLGYQSHLRLFVVELLDEKTGKRVYGTHERLDEACRIAYRKSHHTQKAQTP